jgi:hypothetical protein
VITNTKLTKKNWYSVFALFSAIVGASNLFNAVWEQAFGNVVLPQANIALMVIIQMIALYMGYTSKE